MRFCLALFLFSSVFAKHTRLIPFFGWINVNAKPKTVLNISVFMQKRSIVNGALIALHNFMQLMKPVYTITFCDHLKNVKQILREYGRVNRPFGMSLHFLNAKVIEKYQCRIKSFFMKTGLSSTKQFQKRAFNNNQIRNMNIDINKHLLRVKQLLVQVAPPPKLPAVFFGTYSALDRIALQMLDLNWVKLSLKSVENEPRYELEIRNLLDDD